MPLRCKQLLLLLLLAPLLLRSQGDTVVALGLGKALHTVFANGWIPLDNGWQFQSTGESKWKPIQLYRGKANGPIVAPGEVVWFSLHFFSDSSLQQPLVMRIYQSGPSEIWLDGKLLYTLGIVSTTSDSVKLFTPNFKNLSFPSLNIGQHTLVVRFANIASRYPLFLNSSELYFESWITTTAHAEGDFIVRYFKNYTNHIYMGIGAAFILAVLFLSLFLFFRADRVNLYFAFTSFFLGLFLICIQASINAHRDFLLLSMLSNAFSSLFLLGLLLCVYTIFHQHKGWFFKLLVAAGIISVPLALLIPVSGGAEVVANITVLTMLVVSVRAYAKNKTGALIMVIGLSVMILYLVLNLLSELNVVTVGGLSAWEPFALLVPSLCLAVYLGYSFGALSREKQQMLETQNSLLEKQVAERTAALNQSLVNLQSTQAQLIQSEKMASLGQLTAGIAHEIQNPLNFVNNFSEVNQEMMAELTAEINKGNYDEVKLIAAAIEANEEKINHHGKRAGAIVKGMLEHSRQRTGTKELTDINALCQEYLRLVFGGFQGVINTDFDGTIEKMKIVPQDIGRVLLNLFNNALYAVKECKTPAVQVSTKKINNCIVISVKDNGMGITQKNIDKIFQPFFTTKPTGQGTGLGLSLAYDIIKAHGGELTVASLEGEGAEFIIQLV